MYVTPVMWPKKVVLKICQDYNQEFSLKKRAHVMLTMNLWTEAGICNDGTGTVKDFIYENNQRPPDLPVAVIVTFYDYRGPAISDTIPRCVPKCPITITSQTLDGPGF